MLALFLLLTAVSCKNTGGQPPVEGPTPTVMEHIQSDANLQTLAGLLEGTSLAQTLSSEGLVTFFAPTDEAFAALPQGYLEGLDPQQRLSLLRYHLYMGTVTFDAQAPGENRQLSSLHGDDLFIKETVAGAVVNGTFVTVPNIETSNGHIHKVNELLYPDAFGTVYDNLVKRFDYGQLAGMFVFSGLDTKLEGPGPLTLMAPAQAVIDGLEGDLGMDITDEGWEEILNYHIVRETLTDYGQLTQRAFKTESGDSSYLEVWQPELYVINNTRVEQAPVVSSNGVILPYPAVMLPDKYLAVPTIMYKRFSLGQIRGAMAVAGLNSTLYDLQSEFTVFIAKNNAPGTNTLPPANETTELLKYHILPVKLMAADMQDGQSYTTWQGETLTITKSGNDIFVNGNAKIVLADLEGRNGVVHVINRMLELPQN